MAGPWPTHANLSSTHYQKGAREGLSDGSYGEPQQQCGQDQPVVADRQLVVPRGDGAVLLEPGDHLLDHVALAVALSTFGGRPPERPTNPGGLLVGPLGIVWSIIVNAAGQRYMNEALLYVEATHRMYGGRWA